jgi:threonine synthase
VVILYPEGRVSPTQEAQLTMFNSENGNVRAYAVSGSFDDCHLLTREAFANADLRAQVRLTSANSVNIGRLLPQMVYYLHAVAQAQQQLGSVGEMTVCTPSGNFGNLTAGLIAKRAGLPVARFVAATNVNDVVPAYLATGRFAPRHSVQTIANAMDVGHPSNFERMLWLYGDDRAALCRDVTGSVHADEDVKATIKRVYEERGYLLDPHSAIAYQGLVEQLGRGGQAGRAGTVGIFLATAHPAKFGEVVEPIIGRPIETPGPLANVLSQPRHVLKINATFDAVRRTLGD